MKPWERDALLGSLVRRGARHGLLGGNPTWLVIGGLAFVVRRVRRRDAGVVYSEEIPVGQRVTVEHQPTRPRRSLGGRRGGDGLAGPPGAKVATAPPK